MLGRTPLQLRLKDRDLPLVQLGGADPPGPFDSSAAAPPACQDRRQPSDSKWQLIESFLPVGQYVPYPQRLREQFKGVVWRFRTGSQWREMPWEEFGAPGRRSTSAFPTGPRCQIRQNCSALSSFHVE